MIQLSLVFFSDSPLSVIFFFQKEDNQADSRDDYEWLISPTLHPQPLITQHSTILPEQLTPITVTDDVSQHAVSPLSGPGSKPLGVPIINLEPAVNYSAMSEAASDNSTSSKHLRHRKKSSFLSGRGSWQVIDTISPKVKPYPISDENAEVIALFIVILFNVVTTTIMMMSSLTSRCTAFVNSMSLNSLVNSKSCMLKLSIQHPVSCVIGNIIS